MPKPNKGFQPEKPKNTKQTIKRILGYMQRYKVHLIIVVFAIILSALAGVAGTYMLKPIINQITVIHNSNGSVAYNTMIPLILRLFVIYLIGAVCSYVYNRLMVNISTYTLYQIRLDMFKHMQTLPIRYFDTNTHGEIMSRYTNDTDTLRELVSQTVPHMISSLLTIGGILIMMIVLSPILTALTLLLQFLMLFVMAKIAGKSAKYYVEQQRELGIVNGYIEEMIEGQKVVKVFNHEKAVKNRFDELNENLFHAMSGATTFANILMPIMGNMSYFQYAVTASVGAILAIQGIVPDIGTIASFLTYTKNFSRPFTEISQQFNSILGALAGAERIFELIDSPSEEDNGKVIMVRAENKNGQLIETPVRTGIWAWKIPKEDGTFEYRQVLGDVVFDDVTFGYKEDKVVLHDISLYARPGQKIALVGSTGAGKTTITNLLNRFYDVPDGKITYDGININEIAKAHLRKSQAMVLQDTHLFTGTVRENIRYGRLGASDEEVEKAAKLANAHFFISHLPNGYDTMLTADGANLSQGQRQLIAIARAAVAEPPVLILDEATSSIDTRTEALIEKGMDGLMKGRTVFVIAHRLSTVRNSNAIMVLEQGKIIERGDHDELIDLKGKYYQLYTGAFELS